MAGDEDVRTVKGRPRRGFRERSGGDWRIHNGGQDADGADAAVEGEVKWKQPLVRQEAAWDRRNRAVDGRGWRDVVPPGTGKGQ